MEEESSGLQSPTKAEHDDAAADRVVDRDHGPGDEFFQHNGLQGRNLVDYREVPPPKAWLVGGGRLRRPLLHRGLGSQATAREYSGGGFSVQGWEWQRDRWGADERSLHAAGIWLRAVERRAWSKRIARCRQKGRSVLGLFHIQFDT